MSKLENTLANLAAIARNIRDGRMIDRAADDLVSVPSSTDFPDAVKCERTQRDFFDAIKALLG